MAIIPANKTGAFRRLLNLGLLIGGFGVGQGSIFLAQTWLVASGKMELLALFGTHFSFAMLGIIAVEAGSLTVLSAQIARILHTDGDRRDVWRVYGETTVFRLTSALILIGGLLIFSMVAPIGDFSRNYIYFALPAFLFWAANAAGFLDGLQLSGISGITGSIAYLASALALIAVRDAAPGTAGMATGVALSLGYLLTIAAQYLALRFSGWRVQMIKPTRDGVRRAFIDEISMLSGLLPGQLYFRAQLTIAGMFLGTNGTAILIYTKQIVGAASQIAGFARRIEFPRLVQAVSANPQSGFADVLKIQKISFAIAVLMAVGAFLASLVVMHFAKGFALQAWGFLAAFCWTILSESLGQALVQGLFARNTFHFAAFARVSAVGVAILVAYLFAGTLGIGVFVLSDLLSHAIVISLSAIWLKRTIDQNA